jgi:hypothetical protein
MSNLQKLIMSARGGLSVQEKISDEKWLEIATLCGPAETAEIEIRINDLRAELETIEDWDGDTQDDVNSAIYKFKLLLETARAHRAKSPN